MNIKDIDVNFDFTTDTKGFWDGFWERNDGLGAGGADPDSKSKTLRLYSQLLWSKPLPNGEVMQLEDGRSKFYLRWKDFYFGNDSITASFRYYRNRPFLDIVKKEVKDYHQFVENYLRKLYQIGGEVILPSAIGGINQTRGFRSDIRDRWDLTLDTKGTDPFVSFEHSPWLLRPRAFCYFCFSACHIVSRVVSF